MSVCAQGVQAAQLRLQPAGRRVSALCRTKARPFLVRAQLIEVDSEEPLPPPVHPSSVDRPGSRAGDRAPEWSGVSPSSPLPTNPALSRPGGMRSFDSIPTGDAPASASPILNLMQVRPSGSRSDSLSSAEEPAGAAASAATPNVDRPSGFSSRDIPPRTEQPSTGGGDGDIPPAEKTGDGKGDGSSSQEGGFPWLFVLVAIGGAVLAYNKFFKPAPVAPAPEPAVASCCAKRAEKQVASSKQK